MRHTSVTAILLLIVTTSAASADLVSRFNLGDNGWTPGAATLLEWSEDTGNPGGCLHVIDFGTPDMTIEAPGYLLGNLMPIDGLYMSFDVKAIELYGNTGNLSTFGRVTITGVADSATLDLVPGGIPDDWTKYWAQMDAATWGKTENDWAGILSNVVSISIRLESAVGDETVGFDNFRLGHLPEDATLVDVNIPFGTLLGGGVQELEESDNSYLHGRSSPGFSAFEANKLEYTVRAETVVNPAASFDTLIESRINNPNGTATVRYRNWQTGLFDDVGQYALSTTDQVEFIENTDATRFVRFADGRITLNVKQVVLATFSPLGFDTFIDHVQISVD